MAGLSLNTCRNCGGTVLEGWEDVKRAALPVRLDPRPVRTWRIDVIGHQAHAVDDPATAWRVREHDCNDPCPALPDAAAVQLVPDPDAEPPF